MKRIITADQVRAADRDCIENEPITSIDLMERAAVAFVGVFVSLVPLEYSIHRAVILPAKEEILPCISQS